MADLIATKERAGPRKKPKPGKGAVLKQLIATARQARTELAVRLSGLGLHAGQEQIMLALGRTDGMTPSELAETLDVRPPTITKAIGRLQTEGFVSRSESLTDGRVNHVFLTERGRETLQAVEKAVRKVERRMLGELDKSDKKLLLSLLEQLGDNIADRHR